MSVGLRQVFEGFTDDLSENDLVGDFLAVIVEARCLDPLRGQQDEIVLFDELQIESLVYLCVLRSLLQLVRKYLASS